MVDSGDGVIARDRRALLEHWIDDYPGPGGQEFSWYGLADAREQAVTSCTVTDSLDLTSLQTSSRPRSSRRARASTYVSPWT